MGDQTIFPYIMLIIGIALNVITYRDDRITQETFDLSLFATALAIGTIILFN